jgi:hypothetical protein
VRVRVNITTELQENDVSNANRGHTDLPLTNLTGAADGGHNDQPLDNFTASADFPDYTILEKGNHFILRTFYFQIQAEI